MTKCEGFVRLRLREDNLVSRLMEADCFRYEKLSSILNLIKVIPVRLTSFAQGDCSWEVYICLRLWKQNASATKNHPCLTSKQKGHLSALSLNILIFLFYLFLSCRPCMVVVVLVFLLSRLLVAGFLGMRLTF